MTMPITLVPHAGLRRFRDEFRAFFLAPLVSADPTVPALDAILLTHTTEVADADALCSVCRVLRCDAPARSDCESCARGAA